MRLERDGRPVLNAPTQREIAETIRGLADPDRRFAVLHAGYFRFLQIHIAEPGYVAVEVQDGSLAEHYVVPGRLPIEMAVALMVDHRPGLSRLHRRGAANVGGVRAVR
jgi:hypothetical protein